MKRLENPSRGSALKSAGRWVGIVSCFVFVGCGRETKPPSSPSTPEPAAAVSEAIESGPGLLSPENYVWLPRRGNDGSKAVVWRFDWVDEPEATGYEFELAGLAIAGAAEKKIVTIEVEKSEYGHRWQEPMEAFPRGCAWHVRARFGDAWRGWSDRRIVFIERSEDTKQKVAQLVKLLEDKEKSSDERCAAAEELGEMHADARDAAPALAKASDTTANDPYVAMRAVRALESLGLAAKTAVPELTQMLKDGHLSLKLPIVGILRNIGPAASEALPQLLAIMEQKTPSDYEGLPAKAVKNAWTMLRLGSAGAVAAIGGKKRYPQVVEVLVKIVEGEDRFAAYAAIGTLRNMRDLGPAGVRGIPCLIRGLKKGNSDIKANAAIALGNIGPAAKEAVPALEELVRDYYGGSPSAAEHAADALTKITGVKHSVRR